MIREKRLLEKAKLAAATAESWADLSNALYNQFDGIVARAFPTQAEREQFMKTKEFEEIDGLIDQAIEKFGLLEGAAPIKSGKFLVRLPRSLHTALGQEAKREGVSLNQLVVTKL